MDDNTQTPQGDAQKLVQMGQELQGIENKGVQTTSSPAEPPTPVPNTSPAQPVTPPVVQPATPEPTAPTQKTNMLLWISVVILILAAIAAAVYYFGKGFIGGASVYTPVPTSPTPVPTPNRTIGWQLYTDTQFAFSFEYPPSAQVQTLSDGTISVQVWGPTQKQGAGFIDGVNLSFRPGSLGTQTLQEYVTQKISVLSGSLQVSATSSSTLAQRIGYKFHVNGMLVGDYYYFPLETASYLEIIDVSKDPTSAGFIQEAQDILSTLSFSVASPSATPLASPISSPSGTMGY